jgi:hypothetical protein
VGTLSWREVRAAVVFYGLPDASFLTGLALMYGGSHGGGDLGSGEQAAGILRVKLCRCCCEQDSNRGAEELTHGRLLDEEVLRAESLSGFAVSILENLSALSL